MSRFAHPLPFSPSYDFQATKPVTLNGRAYVPGDRIEKDGLGARRLRQLYESRIISPIAPPAAALLAAPERAEEVVVPVATVETAEAPQEASEAPQEGIVSADGLQAVHRGFGRWYVVDAAGQDVAGPLTKEEALARAAG